MTLNDWRQKNGHRWTDVARYINETGLVDRFYDNRLERLRRRPDLARAAEKRALLKITGGVVGGFGE